MKLFRRSSAEADPIEDTGAESEAIGGTQPANGWCAACGESVEEWGPGPGGRPNAQCPNCLSLERHRFLGVLLRDLWAVLRTSRQVVEFAPQPQVRRVLEQVAPELPVLGTDLMDARFIDFKADGCHLPLQADSVDIILSFHVLEHIPDDAAAMREIARVLAPGGMFIMQVPYRANVPTDEDPDALPEERLRRFGQEDHVRFYGSDLNDRLRQAGLTVDLVTARDRFSEDELTRFNVPAETPIWICRVR